MNRKQKTWTLEEKSNIVLEVLREENTLVEISKKYGANQQLICCWKNEFISNISYALDKKQAGAEKLAKEHEKEKELLINRIDAFAMFILNV